jgi:glutamyl-tRNA synthetase
MSAASTVVTRFAPSPSGHLHVGGARTALFAWAYARGRGGRFILRIEDTDQKRSSDAASMAFLEDLAWLGLDWDEGPEHGGWGGGPHGPYAQSQRLPIYQRFVQRLIDQGKAYRAFETPEELDAARAAATARGAHYRYDRTAMGLDDAAAERMLAEGRPFAVRFAVPAGRTIVVHDQVLGDVATHTSQLDDFVIQKADGYPTYHFAVVVDDELMGVTHVIRAQEHLANTPRHLLLQEALGFRHPAYAHVSVIANPDGSKMSKRDKDKALRAVVRERKLAAPPPPVDGAAAIDEATWRWWLEGADHQLDLEAAESLAASLAVTLPEINVEDFRRHGYLPEVMVNGLALLGWSPGGDVERFDREFLLRRFDLDRIIRSAARFDRAKLLSFNHDAIQALAPEAFRDAFAAHCRRYHPEFLERLSPEQFGLLAAANQKRSKTLEDPVASCRFFLVGDRNLRYDDSKAVRKALTGGQPTGLEHLEALAPLLEAVEPWSMTRLEETVNAYVAAHADGRTGAVAQPLRVAVSGSTVSPGIFETLLILGRRATVERIRHCLSQAGRLGRPEPAR